MARNRKTLVQLRSEIANDLEFRLRDFGADAHSPGTGYTEIAHVVAGVARGLYDDQDYIKDQILTADCDEDTLMRKADERGIPRIEAQFGLGTAVGSGTTGAPIGSDQLLQANNGNEYRINIATSVVATVATVSIVAQQPGRDSNLPAGTVLTLVNPIPDVDPTFVIAAPGISGGADIESIDRLRLRVLDDQQQPPMGGKDYDYVAWARAASVDVTRAWPIFHGAGIGSVAVYFVTEDLANPIPTPALVAIVEAYMLERRPGGLRSFALSAPTAAPMDLTFTLLNPNTVAVRTAIEAEIKDLIAREYKPGGTILLSHIREAISRATGENDFAITLSGNLTYTASQYPTFGVATWPGA